MLKNLKLNHYLQGAIAIAIVICINILANGGTGGSSFYASLDLTEEKRFTLTDPTKDLLDELEEVVYVEVLLEGEFPAGFKRLQRATREKLEDFRARSGFVEFDFGDPNTGTIAQRNERRKQLKDEGIEPVNLRVADGDSKSSQLIYPYAVFYYKGRRQAVNLLENDIPGVNPEVALNNSISLLEYKFVNVIQKLESQKKPAVLFTAGHGELAPFETADFEQTLQEFYNTGRLILDSVVHIRPEVDVLVVAKPTKPFSERDNFKIDQYIMNGGKVLWLLDRVAVDMDSLTSRKEYFPKQYDINLDNLLFKYGIRFKDNLVLDMQCSNIQLVVGFVGDAPQFDFFRYPYHPVISSGATSQHPIVKSLGPINMFFPTTIDTVVETRLPVDKTVLLASSNNSFFQRLPVGMDFNFLRYGLEKENFNKPPQPLAVLYEGEFDSFYANRLDPGMEAGLQQLGLSFKPKSERTSMLVVADGDIARNDYDQRNQRVIPLGYNRNEMDGNGFLFSNKDFLINAIEYLSDDRGLIEARSKDVKLRLLDGAAARQQAGFWQFFNIGLPLLFLLVFGLFYNWLRKRRYAQDLNASGNEE